MKCPVCEKEGLKSHVYPLAGSRTLLYCPSFYDEEGVYHHHDMNISTRNYECSNGHKWSTKGYDPCPNCDFGSEPPEIIISQSKTIQNETKK